MTFTPNEDGINALFEEIAEKIQATDAELRSRLTGKPADEIVDEVTAAIVGIR